ncbi:MAG: UDP-N-acetylmuramoyl-L-alanine--D-glutamate ligase [bacterium]|nr:UDP-N-acetylmuramoyl-L-alanine--D-glutamate ligase [bacterium]
MQRLGLSVTNKNITVLGMARSGVAAANLLAKHGAKVKISDIKPRESLEKFIQQLVSPEIEISTSANQVEDIKSAELVILSPGIPTDIPAVQEAKNRNIPVLSEIELAYQFSQANWIAITGSNGKTTTTTLTGELLKSAWSAPVEVAGNIGFALCNVAEQVPKEGLIVSEISSFQLETITTFKPYIGALLNLTPNHLDRYPDFESYARAKIRIFEYQSGNDFAVLNADDIETQKYVSAVKAKKIFFSRLTNLKEGVFVNQHNVWVKFGNWDEAVIPLKELNIPGEHNVENALAAVAIAVCCGIAPSKLVEPLKAFKGVEHRLEFVRELNGVKYYNDSKATTVVAVITALKSLSGPIILIAGGKDKGSDYTPLRPLLQKKVKQLILIGQARQKMRTALESSCPILEADSMQEAVKLAYEKAVNGDTVLLSPACASYDMFTDFEERGRIFKQIVMEL